MKKLATLSIFLSFFGATSSYAATEVLAWVQAGYGSTCLSNLQGSYGGVSPKDVLTAVACQFWTVSGGGISGCSDAASLGSIVSWAHGNNIKVLLTVYNGNVAWDWNTAHGGFGNASGFSDALIAEANKYGLDGIDIDLEGYSVPLNQYRTDYASSISSLSGKLKSSSTNCKMLTVCTTGDVPDAADNVPNSDWWKDWVGKVDYVHTMLYAKAATLDWKARSLMSLVMINIIIVLNNKSERQMAILHLQFPWGCRLLTMTVLPALQGFGIRVGVHT